MSNFFYVAAPASEKIVIKNLGADRLDTMRGYDAIVTEDIAVAVENALVLSRENEYEVFRIMRFNVGQDKNGFPKFAMETLPLLAFRGVLFGDLNNSDRDQRVQEIKDE